jgi:glutathione S-transferase
MRTLYHFTASPFSRRTRLALAHKKLDVVLKDTRADAALNEEAKTLWPLRTIPVMVEDGFVLGDSTAITHYLDRAYPNAPPVWPTDPRALLAALEIATLVDGALNPIVDLGSRYYALHSHQAWPKVIDELVVARAQGALNVLADRAAARGSRTLTDAGWCGADMWLVTMAMWMEALPARAKTLPHIKQVISLPWSLPAPIARWADTFRRRDDVMSLG